MTNLAGLLALHNLKNGVFEGMMDEGRGCSLHVLLHQCAGQCGGTEQSGGFIWRKISHTKVKVLTSFVTNTETLTFKADLFAQIKLRC